MRWDSGSYKGPNTEIISKSTYPWCFIFIGIFFVNWVLDEKTPSNIIFIIFALLGL